MTRIAQLLTVLLVLLSASVGFAQYYNDVAGQSAPTVSRSMEVRDDQGRVVIDKETGKAKTRVVKTAPKRDAHGNAEGTGFDLARDGAFEGQTVAVIQLYPFDLEPARAALMEKGFSMYRWSNAVPSAEELEEKLKLASQLWVISGASRQLTDAHITVIKKFFDAGHGLYIWGDNTPYHADADALASVLFDSSMGGDYIGSTVVGHKLDRRGDTSGLLPDHLITTGLEHIFEGITIAKINVTGGLKPLIWSSDGNVVTAVYEQNGKRAVLDGGFTRLYNSWDTAGTGRYVKNAAAWLANVERFAKPAVASTATCSDKALAHGATTKCTAPKLR